MTTEPQAQPPEAPERIYIHPTSMEWSPNRWPLEPEEYIEYVRADLPRAAADAERERIIAMADALEYELPNFEQMKGVETLRKKLQAEPPCATGRLTVGAVLVELREMFPNHCYYVDTSSGHSMNPDGIMVGYQQVEVQVDAVNGEVVVCQDAESLDEAMNKVCAWAKSRAGERNG
jgi:hypothetical protein